MSSNSRDASREPATPLSVAPSIANLLIHVGGQVCPVGRKEKRTGLQRLRDLYLYRSKGCDPAPVHLQIDDLKGLRVFETDEAQEVIKICLPAGTYHVTAQRGSRQRNYTLTLIQGASFDLYLGLSENLR